MVREITRDEAFLSQPSEPASPEDLPIVDDLLDTLTAHKDGCVGMAANIRSGNMTGTALQRCALITPMAVDQADYYINNNGETLDGVGEKQLVPCVAITSENVDNLSGFVYTEN